MTSSNAAPAPVPTNSRTIPCRLCGGAAVFRFTTQLINKHDVDYFRCGECESLQTEQPFWLDEAYALNLGDLDCGSAQRNLHNFAACLAISAIWSIRTAVDFGGGDGLLTRLLRDRHIDCYVEDKYGSPTYAQAFTVPPAHPDGIFAFEVFEHFVDPASEIGALFARRPKVLFGSTARYVDQGADWWYLSRRSGHHVFFYSTLAMRKIAAQYGYHLVESGALFLFVESSRFSALKAALSRLALNGIARRLVMAISAFVPATGIGKDTARIRAAEQQSGPIGELLPTD